MPLSVQHDLLEEQNQLVAHRYDFYLWPKKWAAFNNTSFVNPWQTVRMDPADAKKIPTTPGIYTLVIQPGLVAHPSCSYVMYVGKTAKQNLRTRFRQYLKPKKRPKIVRLITLYQSSMVFCFCSIDDVNLVGKAEEDLIAALLPPCNDQMPASVSKVVGAFQ